LAEDALLVVEEDKRADFMTPLGFDEINRRTYGDTEITLLSYTS
jgi:16S rRNA G966 N2-methylase RsmD